VATSLLDAPNVASVDGHWPIANRVTVLSLAYEHKHAEFDRGFPWEIVLCLVLPAGLAVSVFALMQGGELLRDRTWYGFLDYIFDR
jgi:hypothetical protein